MGADPSSQLTHLTLKVLFMLFGEDFIIMKKSGGRLAVRRSPVGSQGEDGSRSPTTEPGTNSRKILEVTSKIIELLTGEVPMRCEDVAVYLSMEEREYLEEHGDLYKAAMTEDQPPLTSPAKGSTDGLHQSVIFQQDCKDKEDDIVITVQTSNYWSEDDQIIITYLENFLNISTNKEHDLQLESHPQVDPIHAWSSHTEDLRRTRMKSVSFDHTYALTYAKAKSLLYREKFQPDPHPTPGSMTGTKVEHCGQGEGNLQHYNISNAVDSTEYTTVLIKEDTYSCSEEHLPHVGISVPDECGQYSTLHIKEEPITYEEPLPYSGTNIFTDPIQYNALHIKEEPMSYEVEVPAEIELYTDGTHCSKIHSKPKQTRRKTEDYPLSCNICKKHFKQKSGLGMHIKMHIKKGEQYTCPDCGRLFISQSDLWKHQCIHSEEKPYSCPECGKRFSKATNLNNHQRIHATKNPFSCGECGKQFVSNNNLRRHQKKHIAETPNEEFYCLECGKTFTDKPAYRKHQRYHAGDNPYPCADCGRRFIKRINLIKHQRLHTRKNLHSCQECGKFFMSRAYLVRHMNSHTKKKRPCSCPVCGKYFLSSLDLIIHQRVHKAEKPGSTSEWRNSFIRKLGVVIQERNNVDEKPYSCSDCGELFERKLQLIRHQKNSHQGGTLDLMPGEHLNRYKLVNFPDLNSKW